MGKKNKKEIKKKETETDTDTDTDTDNETETETNTSMLSKLNNLSKKTKLYIGMILILIGIAGYMWYRNKKMNENILPVNNLPQLNQMQNMQSTQLNQMQNMQSTQLNPTQLNSSLLNPIQEIQLTQSNNYAPMQHLSD